MVSSGYLHDSGCLRRRVLLSVLLLCLSYAKSSSSPESLNQVDGNVTAAANCSPPAVDEFPNDFLTESQREKGGFILYLLIVVYLVWTLGIICDEYFVPALEIICKNLNLQRDVAGATFMAAGTSSPELFANIIGTFIIKSDLGIGTIVGSAVFNIFGVIAICGIFSPRKLPIDWFPITRDCIYYGLTVIALMIFLYDGEVYWFESLSMLFGYAIYIVLMYLNDRIEIAAKFVQKTLKPLLCHSRVYPSSHSSHGPSLSTISIESGSSNGREAMIGDKNINQVPFGLNEAIMEEPEDPYEFSYPWEMPEDPGVFGTLMWLLFFPVNMLLFLTIPNVRKNSSCTTMYPLTFVMCIGWIGVVCYVSTWMITIIGFTFSIPDSVMGLSFLAIGTSFPEVFSAFLVSRKGYGAMAVSTSIGSNTFDILVGLGLPWFVMALVRGSEHHDWLIKVNSSGLAHVVLSLLVSLVVLYLLLLGLRFILSKTLGIICLFIYVIFLTISILVETNVFYVVNLPMCPSNY